MENIALINNFGEIKDITTYFACEILLIVGVILNIILLPLRRTKMKVERISNLSILLIFGLNILMLLIDYIVKLYNHSFLGIYFEPNNGSIFLKILINVFMLFFVLMSLKLTKKYRFKVLTLNSILLLLTLSGCLIVQAENYLLSYLLLETVSLLVYKYGSNMRIRKIFAFSTDFIILSVIATLIFVVSYFTGFEVVKSSQISIINVCLSIAILMKIGIFPIYNYLISKPSKTNTLFSILLFCYLPWIGVITFNKMSNAILPSDEIYQISMLAFVVVSLITFAFYASKHKNIIKFFANFSYFVNGLCILSVVYFQSDYNSIILSTMFTFSLLSIYSLMSVLKLNLKLEKLYVANFKGLFLNNRLFSFLFSAILLMMTGLIPSGITKEFVKILKNIYIYDKTGFIAVCAISLLMLLILFNSLKIVQNIYTFNRNKIVPKFIKGTTIYYIVPLFTVIFLLLKTIL